MMRVPAYQKKQIESEGAMRESKNRLTTQVCPLAIKEAKATPLTASCKSTLPVNKLLVS